jgi:small subunit ribosomal protein S21
LVRENTIIDPAAARGHPHLFRNEGWLCPRITGKLVDGPENGLRFPGEFPARGGVPHMPLVKIKEDETFENALRRFKRKCEKSGILSELKKRQHYEKPSAKRKRKMLAARKKTLKRLAQERRMIG